MTQSIFCAQHAQGRTPKVKSVGKGRLSSGVKRCEHCGGGGRAQRGCCQLKRSSGTPVEKRVQGTLKTGSQNDMVLKSEKGQTVSERHKADCGTLVGSVCAARW